MREAVYPINVWADTRHGVMAVAREVRLALDGYRSLFKDIPVIGACLDGFNRDRDPDTGACCVSMRFAIHYQES